MRTLMTVMLLSLSNLLNGQDVKRNSLENVYPLRLRERPVLDSSVNVNNLSREQCYRLLGRVFDVDQQYRVLHNQAQTDAEKWHFGHLFTINDPANQTILLKILRRHGWPCRKDGRKLSFKAYIIAWHARSDYETMRLFHPYMVAAKRNNCIHPAHFAEFEQHLGLWEKSKTKQRK